MGSQLALVTTAQLAQSRIEHYVGSEGSSFRMSGPNVGLDSDAIEGVINRIVAPWAPWLEYSSAEDRAYGIQELHALYLSILTCFRCPVVNAASPQGLGGAQWSPVRLKLMAVAAGLTLAQPEWPADGVAKASSEASFPRTVIVLGQDVMAPPNCSQSVIRGAQRLAEMSGTALLGVQFHLTRDTAWRFVHSTPLPDLRLGGARLLRGLHGLLVKEHSIG